MRASLAFLFVLVNVLAVARSDIWDITEYTGDVSDASTDADVYIQLHGTARSSDPILLDNYDNNHERGQVDHYPGNVTPYLGNITRLDVWHDNGGSGWYLNKIVVSKQMSRLHYVFICNRWFDIDEGDFRIGRTLFPSTNNQ